MTLKERYSFVIAYFQKNIPEARTELNYNNAYQLTVAVILSAQCTDKRVNLITPNFFNRFPDFKTLSEATVEKVFEYIKSCSYPNNKSKHLVGMATKVMSDFDGELPSDIKKLQELPGVGRKTANVLLSVLYDIPAMAVDTHVFRVSKRIGLTYRAKTPLETEKQLTKNIPEKFRNSAHHWLILHGRYTCTARKPKCDTCGIKKTCRYYEKNIAHNISQ